MASPSASAKMEAGPAEGIVVSPGRKLENARDRTYRYHHRA